MVVYPLQIHDSYAVDLTLRFPEPHIELEQLQHLNPQGCLQFDRGFSSLGQTLVFFAQPDGYVDNLSALADACLASILPETDRNLYNLSTQGNFLGSPIFEYNFFDDTSKRFNSIPIFILHLVSTSAHLSLILLKTVGVRVGRNQESQPLV